jgi:hypothetical protein
MFCISPAQPAFPRAAPRSGTLVCEGVLEHSPYANDGFYEIGSDDPCHIDGHTDVGKEILAQCHEGDLCRLKAFGTWAVDFYVKRVISIERLQPATSAGMLSSKSAPEAKGSLEAVSIVSDSAFVMPREWFVWPGSQKDDREIAFRRFSVAVHKNDLDSLMLGAKKDIQFIGDVGTFFNSVIFTCHKDKSKSDFLTFHIPPDVSPASFKYDEWRPKLEINLLADKVASHFTGEYIKGDIFVDANSVGVETFVTFLDASSITIDFGDKSDRLNLSMAEKLSGVDLLSQLRELLPIGLKIAPNDLVALSNNEMLERCLQYKKSRQR